MTRASALSLGLEHAVTAIRSGGVIAYPTESVYGLGGAADSERVAERVLQIKQRPRHKGLITIIFTLDQVLPWLDRDYASMWNKALESWPASITWLFPASDYAPAWLTGGQSSIALRIPDHPVACELCRLSDKPLISTSANVAGQPALSTGEEVMQQFGDVLDSIVNTECGDYDRPSQIRDLISGHTLR